MSAFKTVSIAGLFLILLLQIPSWAFAKKNICTIALNSNDEINLFKKYLPANDFNFIELVPQGMLDLSTNPEKWFLDDCDKKISCDSLIVSAHFAGTFFGLLKSYRISLETLEKASCDSRCDSILKNPKEVFLFGCNTLAGKDSDGRGPDQYRRDLIADGISPEYAEQMVSFKYSPLGTSYGDRMRRVFSNVPAIYGFDSRAPLGDDMAVPLRAYLKSAGPHYAEIWASGDPQKHLGLLQLTNAIPGKKMIEEPGLKLQAGEVRPACFLGDPQVTEAAKLSWIEQVLSSNRRLEYVPDIGDYLNGEKNNHWSSAEDAVFGRIGQNTPAKDEVMALLTKPMDSFLSVQVKMVQMAKQFNWISDGAFKNIMHDLVVGDLTKKVTSYRLDAVCSLTLPVTPALDPREIPDGAWSQVNFISMLGCLSQNGSFNGTDIQRKILEITLNGPGPLEVAASSSLTKMPDLQPLQMLALLPILSNPATDSGVKINLLKVAGHFASAPEDFKETIFEMFLAESDQDVARQDVETLLKLDISKNQKIIQKLEDAAATAPSFKSAYAVRILKNLPQPQQYLKIFESDLASPDVGVQSEALQAVAMTGVNDAGLQLSVVNILRATPEFRIMLAANGSLSAMNLQHAEVQNALISIIKRENVQGDGDKKAALASILLRYTVLTPEMKTDLGILLAGEKNDEVKFRLTKTLNH